MPKTCLVVLLLLTFFLPVNSAAAQAPADNPFYIVRSGDTLVTIAQRFGISVNDLINVNNLSNPDLLAIGTRLIIPGYAGISGELLTRPVTLGESLEIITIRNHISTPQFLQLNRLTSPEEIFAGVNLILPEHTASSPLAPVAALQPGQSLLEAAILQSVSPWTISLNHSASLSTAFIPGDLLLLDSPDPTKQISPFSSIITSLEVTPLPLIQGKTITIRLRSASPIEFTGALGGSKLHFYEESPNQYVALYGVHALASPGLTPLSISLTKPASAALNIQENLLLKAGNFIKDPPLTVSPETIDPDVTQPEEREVFKILESSSNNRLWDSAFSLPVDEPICIQSTYGNRRSYNNSPFNYFHTGVDFGVCKNLNIYAPAPGKVVFANKLNVRGNATIIDHGWGVFSGYWHQAEIKVKVGDLVTTGQLIGLIGSTGRVTGPHLHWEIVVNSVQVEPLDWVDSVFPK